MSDNNGKESRILSLGSRPAKDKASDWATKADVVRLVADEASKVHSYYLQQIPAFVARMIQDALVSYGLVVLPASDIAPEVAPDVSGVPCGTEPVPDSFSEPVVIVDSPEVA